MITQIWAHFGRGNVWWVALLTRCSDSGSFCGLSGRASVFLLCTMCCRRDMSHREEASPFFPSTSSPSPFISPSRKWWDFLQSRGVKKPPQFEFLLLLSKLSLSCFCHCQNKSTIHSFGCYQMELIKISCLPQWNWSCDITGQSFVRRWLNLRVWLPPPLDFLFWIFIIFLSLGRIQMNSRKPGRFPEGFRYSLTSFWCAKLWLVWNQIDSGPAIIVFLELHMQKGV